LRIDGRRPDELRQVTITRDFTRYAEGSVLIKMGDTWVVTTASVDDKVPQFLRGTGRGWVTAEYAMLPRATSERRAREASGRQSGRSMEIQRLVGRSLRAVVDLDALGERTIWVDCDVLQADGGTRTAAVTGAFVALFDAFRRLNEAGRISTFPLLDYVAGVSVGLVKGEPVLDLCFAEDAEAAVDMNVVRTGNGRLVEVQGTAERGSFSEDELEALLDLARAGCAALVSAQREALGPHAALIDEAGAGAVRGAGRPAAALGPAAGPGATVPADGPADVDGSRGGPDEDGEPV